MRSDGYSNSRQLLQWNDDPGDAATSCARTLARSVSIISFNRSASCSSNCKACSLTPEQVFARMLLVLQSTQECSIGLPSTKVLIKMKLRVVSIAPAFYSAKLALEDSQQFSYVYYLLTDQPFSSVGDLRAFETQAATITQSDLVSALVDGTPDAYLKGVPTQYVHTGNTSTFGSRQNSTNSTLLFPSGIVHPRAYMMLFYRRDLFMQLGLTLPQTWSSLVTMARKVQSMLSSGSYSFRYALCLDVAPSCKNNFYLMAIAASFLQTKGPSQGLYFDPLTLDPMVSNPAMQQALEVLTALLSLTPPSTYQSCGLMNMLFSSGECLMTIDWEYLLWYEAVTKPASVHGKVSAAPLPGSTHYLDRQTNTLLPCNSSSCPYAIPRKVVPIASPPVQEMPVAEEPPPYTNVLQPPPTYGSTTSQAYASKGDIVDFPANHSMTAPEVDQEPADIFQAPPERILLTMAAHEPAAQPFDFGRSLLDVPFGDDGAFVNSPSFSAFLGYSLSNNLNVNGRQLAGLAELSGWVSDFQNLGVNARTNAVAATFAAAAAQNASQDAESLMPYIKPAALQSMGMAPDDAQSYLQVYLANYLDRNPAMDVGLAYSTYYRDAIEQGVQVLVDAVLAKVPSLPGPSSPSVDPGFGSDPSAQNSTGLGGNGTSLGPPTGTTEEDSWSPSNPPMPMDESTKPGFVDAVFNYSAVMEIMTTAMQQVQTLWLQTHSGASMDDLRLSYWLTIGYSYSTLNSSAVSNATVVADGISHLSAGQLSAVVAVPAAVLLLTLLLLLYAGYSQRLRHRSLLGRVLPPPAAPLTTLLVTDVQNSTLLWESLPCDVMDTAMKLHHDCVRAQLMKHSGFESLTEGDSFILAFHTPWDAVRFSMDLQAALLHLPWPLELLQIAEARDVWALPLPLLAQRFSGSAGMSGMPASSTAPSFPLGPLGISAMNLRPSGRVGSDQLSVDMACMPCCPPATPQPPSASAAVISTVTSPNLRDQPWQLLSPSELAIGEIQASLVPSAADMQVVLTELQGGSASSLPEAQSSTSPLLPANPSRFRPPSALTAASQPARSSPLPPSPPHAPGTATPRNARASFPAIPAGTTQSGSETSSAAPNLNPAMPCASNAWALAGTSPVALPLAVTRQPQRAAQAQGEGIVDWNMAQLLSAARESNEGLTTFKKTTKESFTDKGCHLTRVVTGRVRSGLSKAFTIASPFLESGVSGLQHVLSLPPSTSSCSWAEAVQRTISFSSEPRDTPGDALLLYRGLRVRIGMTCGGEAKGCIVEIGGRVQYLGTFLRWAKAVCDAGHGGQVLLCATTFSHLPTLPQTLVMDAGTHLLGDTDKGQPGRDPVPLYTVTDSRLYPRVILTPPLRTSRQVSLEAASAPVGQVCVVFMHVVRASLLLAEMADIAKGALKQFQTVAGSLLFRHGGYCVEAADGLCVAAFSSTVAAACWALDCQEAMMWQDWPAALLESELGREVHVHHMAGDIVSSQNVEVVLVQGLHLAVGLHVGPLQSLLSPTTARMDYRGRAINKAARIAALAKAGQVLCSAEVRACCQPQHHNIDSAFCGMFTLKGVLRQVEVFELRRMPNLDPTADSNCPTPNNMARFPRLLLSSHYNTHHSLQTQLSSRTMRSDGAAQLYAKASTGLPSVSASSKSGNSNSQKATLAKTQTMPANNQFLETV